VNEEWVRKIRVGGLEWYDFQGSMMTLKIWVVFLQSIGDSEIKIYFSNYCEFLSIKLSLSLVSVDAETQKLNIRKKVHGSRLG
jgi:hypothetical protein